MADYSCDGCSKSKCTHYYKQYNCVFEEIENNLENQELLIEAKTELEKVLEKLVNNTDEYDLDYAKSLIRNAIGELEEVTDTDLIKEYKELNNID